MLKISKEQNSRAAVCRAGSFATKIKKYRFWFYISPWLIGLICFTAIPMGASLYYSMCKFDVTNSPVWIGFKNFEYLCGDSAFYKAIGNTLWFSLMKVPINLLLSLGVAMLLNRNIRLKKFFRAVVYLPAVMPSVAGIMVWVFIFDYDNGVLNMLLNVFHLPPVKFFSEGNAIYSILAMSLWSAIGPTMIVFLAALQGVPRVYYEALEIDGGNSFTAFVHLTLPLISPTVLYLFITGLISSLQVFSEMYLATGGGPNDATVTLALLIYRFGMVDMPQRVGLAAALSWVVFVMTLILSLLTFKLSRKMVYYEGE